MNNINDNNDNDNQFDEYFNIPFRMSELMSSVNGLKIGKASGPDGTLSEMIKNTIHEITPIFLPLYNRILSTGQFPAAWSKSILCPLFKSGSLTDPNNFQGISLIDVLNKILTAY